jgi:hypothetical protein
MRNNFKKFNGKEKAPLPPGLAVGSWKAIYDLLLNQSGNLSYTSLA